MADGRFAAARVTLLQGQDRSEQHLQRDFHTVSGSVGAAPARRARWGDLAPPLRNRWFADSPLEALDTGVRVSEVWFADAIDEGRRSANWGISEDMRLALIGPGWRDLSRRSGLCDSSLEGEGFEPSVPPRVRPKSLIRDPGIYRH